MMILYKNGLQIMAFPSVYVWMRQLGAGKLQPYNSAALIHVLFIFLTTHQNVLAHSAQSLE